MKKYFYTAFYFLQRTAAKFLHRRFGPVSA